MIKAFIFIVIKDSAIIEIDKAYKITKTIRKIKDVN